MIMVCECVECVVCARFVLLLGCLWRHSRAVMHRKLLAPGYFGHTFQCGISPPARLAASIILLTVPRKCGEHHRNLRGPVHNSYCMRMRAVDGNFFVPGEAAQA